MKALRFLLAVLLTAPVMFLTATTAQAADLTVTGWTGYQHVFFASLYQPNSPNRITVTGTPGSPVDLTQGTPSGHVQLAHLALAAGTSPGCLNDVVENSSMQVDVQYGSRTTSFTFPMTISWVCNNEAMLELHLPPAQTLDAGDGRTLTVAPYNDDPYSGSHRGTVAVQWPQNTTLDLRVLFDLTLSGPADTTPPTITPTVTGTQGGNGWYTSPTDLTWSVTDPESAVSTTGCADQHLTADQPKTTYSCSATSAGGSSGPVTEEIGLDLTDPAVVCGTTPSFLVGQPDATVSGTVTDAGSGPAATAVSAPADTASAGSRSVSLTGTDNAGRTTTVQCPYSVGYAWSGFFSPVGPGMNTVKAGQAVPLKWRVTDYAGAPVSTLTSASLTAVGLSCSLGTTVDQPAEDASGNSGLQNLGNGYYQLNWKTPKGYAGSCKTAQLDLGDGMAHTAAFAFTR